MSRIAVVVNEVTNLPHTFSVLRQITEAGLSNLKKKIEKKEPVYEPVLYMNDHDHVAHNLRRLLKELPQSSAKLSFHELKPSQKYIREKNRGTQITARQLLNKIERFEKYLEDADAYS